MNNSQQNHLHPSKFKAWVEATRPRTLPVSVAGVFAGCAAAIFEGGFKWLPAAICMLFAILAQIASNLANEYYDYAYGFDKKGREGFRRGVTEGDLTPKAMFRATYALVTLDSLLGLSLLYWGGLWLLLPGIAIAIFAVAYSAGPYPLSHHGLGDIAVIIFFGLVPVVLTCYVQTEIWSWSSVSIPMGAAIGLMAANVLVVNNYRDMNDDRKVGKKTTVVIFGRKAMATAYLCSGIIAAIIMAWALWQFTPWVIAPCVIYLVLHIIIWRKLCSLSGKALNPLLGMTAMNLLLFSLLIIPVALLKP